MLSEDELKLWLQRDFSRSDKLLIILSGFDAAVSVADIKAKGERLGCRVSKWNVSDIFNRANGVVLKLPEGYEISEKGAARLKELGVVEKPIGAIKVGNDFLNHLGKIKDPTTKAFVEEAIKCYEAGLYRSAIVMSWVAAISVLHHEVFTNHLAAFNAETARVDSKWKPAVAQDDLSKMKESDFLDRLVGISLIGKNVKTELVNALNLRNGCGHPNSLKVGANKTASHIETLLLNVFDRFSV